MIKRKTSREIDFMRQAGEIAAKARNLAGELIRVGETTKSIDKAVYEYIRSQGAEPTFLGYRGYPASICTSINEQVIHGMPSSRKLIQGDIVSIDIGTTKSGYIGDCAATFIVGEASLEAKKLVTVTRECFYEGLKFALPGNRVSHISAAVQEYAESHGFSLVREYTGHGIGTELHEEPEIPNYVAKPRRRPDPRLIPGMTIALEPMVNAGVAAIKLLDDGWTVVTKDGKNSAHYENTILITDNEPEILTICEGMP